MSAHTLAGGKVTTACGMCLCMACCSARPAEATNRAVAGAKAFRALHGARSSDPLSFVCSGCSAPAHFVWRCDGHQCIHCGSRVAEARFVP